MANRETNDILRKAEALSRSRLSDKRHGHVLRVADTAEHLALVHGLDTERTRLAALLHDAAREVGKRDLLRLAREWDLSIGPSERENPGLLHGPVAAGLARRELDIGDEEVLEAVRVHTTAAPGMSPLVLAVYIADKIEPARDYPSVERMRSLADMDLRDATRETLGRVIAYNEGRGRSVHPDSRDALAWLERTV